MVWMHGEPADVEAALLLVPEHRARDHAAVIDDGAPTVSEVRTNRVRCLLQGAGRRVGRARLGGKGEADQLGDGRGIGWLSRPEGPKRCHTTPRSIRRPA